MFLFSSDELHKITTVRAGYAHADACHVFSAASCVGHADRRFFRDLLAAFRAFGERAEHRIDKTNRSTTSLFPTFSTSKRNGKDEKPFFRKIIKNRMVDFLVALSRTSEELPVTTKPTRHFAMFCRLLMRLVTKLKSISARNCAFTTLAASCGMSQNFFTSCFKKSTVLRPKPTSTPNGSILPLSSSARPTRVCLRSRQSAALTAAPVSTRPLPRPPAKNLWSTGERRNWAKPMNKYSVLRRLPEWPDFPTRRKQIVGESFSISTPSHLPTGFLPVGERPCHAFASQRPWRPARLFSRRAFIRSTLFLNRPKTQFDTAHINRNTGFLAVL